MNPELHWDCDDGWTLDDLLFLNDNSIDIFHLAEVLEG